MFWHQLQCTFGTVLVQSQSILIEINILGIVHYLDFHLCKINAPLFWFVQITIPSLFSFFCCCITRAALTQCPSMLGVAKRTGPITPKPAERDSSIIYGITTLSPLLSLTFTFNLFSHEIIMSLYVNHLTAAISCYRLLFCIYPLHSWHIML